MIPLKLLLPATYLSYLLHCLPPRPVQPSSAAFCGAADFNPAPLTHIPPVFPSHLVKMVGEWSQIMPATKEVQIMTGQVKKEVEEKMNKKYKIFTAKSYQQQEGKEFCIKVETGENCPGSLYLYVSRDLSAKLKLTDAVWIELSELCDASTLPFPLDQLQYLGLKTPGKKCDIFRGINYKTLLTRMLGYTNYFIKVQVGEGEEDYHILRVGCAVTQVRRPTLTNLLENKTLIDDIEYFE
ncbi:uncharacterized protein LOC117593639 [Esox lucius]|uniref:Cystatin domain-containing protein n=2 Tax=Esox lucius TaxID=8010 RepID=A0AAY5LA56_ESOLU|nr:uncharacterized protein LOC117593639 [Esox lucius]